MSRSTVSRTTEPPIDTFQYVTLNPPLLTMPWDIGVGSHWQTTSTLTAMTSSGPNQFESTWTYDVVGSGTVSTPAGRFDGLEIDQTLDGSSSLVLVHADVGSIPDADYTFLDYELVPWP